MHLPLFAAKISIVKIVMHGTVDVTAATMANSDAKHLYDDLLRKSGYNKLIRPVMNNSDKLIVKLGLRLSQLIDVVRICCSISIPASQRILLLMRLP